MCGYAMRTHSRSCTILALCMRSQYYLNNVEPNQQDMPDLAIHLQTLDEALEERVCSNGHRGSCDGAWGTHCVKGFFDSTLVDNHRCEKGYHTIPDRRCERQVRIRYTSDKKDSGVVCGVRGVLVCF